jgi:hypothetical protein
MKVRAELTHDTLDNARPRDSSADYERATNNDDDVVAEAFKGLFWRFGLEKTGLQTWSVAQGTSQESPSSLIVPPARERSGSLGVIFKRPSCGRIGCPRLDAGWAEALRVSTPVAGNKAKAPTQMRSDPVGAPTRLWN